MSEQPLDTASRRALHELIDLLGEVDRRWVSPEWNLPRFSGGGVGE